MNENIVVEYKGKSTVLAIKDILLIHTDKEKAHRVIFETERGNLVGKETMRQISTKCEDLFLCHRSTFVNLTKIVEVDRRALTITLTNGRTCPCSRRKYRKLVEEWLKANQIEG